MYLRSPGVTLHREQQAGQGDQRLAGDDPQCLGVPRESWFVEEV